MEKSHHVILERLRKKNSLFFEQIESIDYFYLKSIGVDCKNNVDFKHGNMRFNGAILPRDPDEALKLGLALFGEEFPPYIEFVEKLLEQIKSRSEEYETLYREKNIGRLEPSEIRANLERAKPHMIASEIKGVQGFLRMSLQENGIKEANKGN